MSDSITNYYDKLNDEIEEKQKSPNSKDIETFKNTYPELAQSFKDMQQEQYKLFSQKMLDYGLGNISLGGDLNNLEDKNYALQGIQIRLNDKINRLKNLLKNGKNYVPGENVKDTFIDVATYGMIAMLVIEGKWKK
jgi:hypothetical protein